MTDLQISALAGWLRAQSLCTTQDIGLRAISGGQSNPTFLVSAGDRRFVLRKRPAGQLLASAHAIDREFRVMKALQGCGVPVPAMLAYCEDVSIIGTEFFVMEFLEGRVFMDPSLPGVSPAERGAMYRDMNRVIAALHGVDHLARGLDGYGNPGNYFGRQIARWSRQCAAATVPLPSAMRHLMEWLPQHIPAGDEVTLVHGDYRLDNLIFHPTAPKVIGVLDWELSTLGNPLSDFSAHCMSWHILPSVWRGIGGLELASLGIPAESEYVAMYSQATGRDPSRHWDFYLAFNFFRLAAILHGIRQRVADGTAAGADAQANGRAAQPLAELAWLIAQRSRA